MSAPAPKPDVLPPMSFVLRSSSSTEAGGDPFACSIDPAPGWLVALGENWNGSACGWVEFRDLFKHVEGFAGFGSSINCFGVAFSIKVAGATATKRTPIKCGSN